MTISSYYVLFFPVPCTSLYIFSILYFIAVLHWVMYLFNVVILIFVINDVLMDIRVQYKNENHIFQFIPRN